MLPRITPQRLLIGGLLLTLAAVAARIVAVQGFIRPVRVVSGSMAERLLGEHYSVTCADCGFVFPFGVESPPPDERAVCPNCGFARNAVRNAERKRGDRVLIDRAAYLFDPPRRFDLIAFRDPSQPLRWVVKRAVGLPGERIAIRHGDLYVDGKLSRKSLAEFHRLSLPVHDSAFATQPRQSLPPRWRPDAEPSGWTADGSGFKYVPRTALPAGDQPLTPATDWLTYHHWRCFANPFPRSAEAPVADNFGYNQGESRELQSVVDIVLRCRIALAGFHELALQVHDGREWFFVHLNWGTRTAELRRSGEPVASATLSSELPQGQDALDLEFGLIDRQVIVAIGDAEVLRQEYEPELQEKIPFQPLAQPISLGGIGSEIRVTHLRLRRDVYYLDPWSVGQRWEMDRPSGPDEYVVLGDNPFLSEDSRRWPKPILKASSILGRVILWQLY